MDEQIEFAEAVVARIEEDYGTAALTAKDLLDYMGLVGVEFIEGAGASDAYMQLVARRAKESGRTPEPVRASHVRPGVVGPVD